MNQKKYKIVKPFTFLFLMICLMISCTNNPESIGFVQPQPQAGKSINQIPKEYMGDYLLPDTNKIMINFSELIDYNGMDSNSVIFNFSNRITITSDSIYNTIEGKWVILKTEMDSIGRQELGNKGIDTIIISVFPNSKYAYSIDSSGESYLIQIHIVTKMFILGPYGTIKKYKNKFYFNAYNPKYAVWKCYQLNLINKANDLSINYLSKDDYDILNRLIKIEDDKANTENGFDPTKKVFKKLLRMNGFENKIIVKRIQ